MHQIGTPSLPYIVVDTTGVSTVVCRQLGYGVPLSGYYNIKFMAVKH